MTTCPLCGFAFDETALSCSAVCPLAAVQGCSLLCCPNCGYQMVDERKSKVAQMLRWVLIKQGHLTEADMEDQSK